MNSRRVIVPDTAIRLTTFSDTSGRQSETIEMTLEELQKVVAAVKGRQKSDLPLLCPADFGDQRSAKGSLRHKGNVVQITGVAIDYDGGIVPAQDAVGLLQDAGIGALVYETPSCTPSNPRWRVLAPLSRPGSPRDHCGLTARLNGVLDGVAAAESFALSQSFYYGAIEGAEEKLITIVEGDFVDLRADLDIRAIGPQQHQVRDLGPELERHLKEEIDWGMVYGSSDLEALRRTNPQLFDRLTTDLGRKGKLWSRWNGDNGLRDRSRSGRDRSIVQILRSMAYTASEAIAVAVAFGGEKPSKGRGLVEHDKSGRDIDLMRYWVRCWVRAEDTVPKSIADLSVAELEHREGRSKGVELRRISTPPGIVGDLVAYFRRASTRELPDEVLVAAAVATVALAAQNRFDVGDERLSTSIHVYLIVVAQTGFGKSELGRLIFNLLDPKVAGSSIVETIASGPALLKRLHRIANSAWFGPTLLYLADEFGLKLQARISRSGPTHMKDLIDEIISAFGRGNSVHTGKAYADRKNDIDPIARPAVNVLGFATEKSLADALTTTDAEIGFVNRFLLIWLRETTAALQKPLGDVDQTVPKHAERFLRGVGSRSISFAPEDEQAEAPGQELETLRSAISADGPRRMPLSEDAKRWLDQLTEDLNRRQAEATGVMQTLWVRARQHVLIIAGVLAIGQIDIDAPRVPTVGKAELQWAWDFVSWSIGAWEQFFETRVSGNEEQEAMNAIKDLLGKVSDYATGGALSHRANYGNARYNSEICATGRMPQSLIGRELRGIRSDNRARALAALVENEEIEREEVKAEGSGKPTTVYRLMAPARRA